MTDEYKYLYTMSYIDPVDGNEYFFYVGKAVDQDWEERKKQHRYAVKKGTEDKYVFARMLEKAGIEWFIKELKRVPKGEYSQDWEHWWVIDFIRKGHPIKNMKHGDLDNIDTMVADTEIRSVEDVKKARIRREQEKERKAFERSEALRKRVEEENPSREMDELFKKIRRSLKKERNVADTLKSKGWKDNQKAFDGYKFRRGKDDGQYFVTEENSGVTVHNSSYRFCYTEIARHLSNEK